MVELIVTKMVTMEVPRRDGKAPLLPPSAGLAAPKKNG
jgi:hypothetical protein